MLQIKQICKQYKTGDLVQNALNNVSLNLRDNEFVAILGPSGSGKTTLLNIIGGLDRYDSGDLIINGISMLMLTQASSLPFFILCVVLVGFSFGGLLVVFGGRFFVGLFLEGDQPAVVEQAQQYLNTIAGFLIVLGLLFIFRNALQGMGSTLVPMLAGAAELVVRVLVAFLLPAVMGYAAICIAGPAAWVGATIPLIVCYLLLMRRLRSVRPEKKPEETAP